MSNNPLTKMVGPYPLGVWLAVIGGGLGIAYFLQRGDRAGQAAAAQGASVDPLAPVGLPSGGAVQYYDGDLLDPEERLTNVDWARLTAPRLAALTGRSPTSVQSALTRYINGEATDCMIVNAALGAGWWPPESVPPVICVGPVSADPDARPPAIHPQKPGLVLGDVQNEYGEIVGQLRDDVTKAVKGPQVPAGYDMAPPVTNGKGPAVGAPTRAVVAS